MVGDDSFFKTYEVLIFMSMLAEAVRRTIWALIRIENEFHNNFENYRSILVIPGLMDNV
jgi:septin family protein